MAPPNQPSSLEPVNNRSAARRAAEDQFLQQVCSDETVAPQIPPSSVPMPRVLRALRNPDFRLFWAGNFLSNIGTWMQNVAQGWLVLQIAPGHAAFWLGVVGFAASSPMLVFATLGGVIADRVDKRRLIMVTQTSMMLFAFILAWLTWRRVVTLPEIVLLAFATGLAQSLNAPSYQAMVPQLVPREDLTNAIALNSAQFNMSRVIGPTLGGFAMAWVGIAGNFFLNGLSFLAVIFALLHITYPPPVGESEGTLWSGLTEGFSYIFDQKVMFLLLTMVALASIFALPYITFIPLFAKNILNVDERGFGLLLACTGTGAFLGAVTVAYLGKIERRGRFVVRAASMFYVAVIGFSFSRSVWLSGALLAMAGYCMILMVATVNTLLQFLAADEMRGRVMSLYATAFLGFAPLGSLLAGSLAGALTAPVAIATMSAAAMLGTLALYYTRPEIQHLN